MSKPYATLNEAERWNWHADVYAFRRMVLALPTDERTSPCDPEGRWFDENLVRAACARLRDKRDRPRQLRRAVADEELRRGGRDLCNQWAKQNGFADFTAAEEAGHGHQDVYQWIAASVKPMPADPHSRWRGDAAALGVTAREFNPSPERMAEGRRVLGIEPEATEQTP